MDMENQVNGHMWQEGWMMSVSSSVQSLSNTAVLEEYTQLQINLDETKASYQVAEPEVGGMGPHGMDCETTGSLILLLLTNHMTLNMPLKPDAP